MMEGSEIVQSVARDLRAGAGQISVCELAGSARALFLHGIAREFAAPLLVITPTREEAEAVAADFAFFIDADPAPNARPEVLLLPEWGLLPFETDSPDNATVGERMRFLEQMLAGRPDVFVASAPALIQKLPPWELFADFVSTVKQGAPLDADAFATALVRAGYESSPMVTRVGEFSVRGGIIDVFSPAQEHPFRIELFGDSIESLRAFDPETQRSVAAMDAATALPVRELLVTQAGIDRFLKNSGDREAARELREGFLPPGAEFLAPFFYTLESLFRYLPDRAVCAVIEPEAVNARIAKMREKIAAGRTEELESGRVLPELSALYLDEQEVGAELAARPVLRLSLLAEGEGRRTDTRSAESLGLRLARTAPAVAAPAHSEGTIQGLAARFERLRAENHVVVVCGTKESADRVQRLFEDTGPPVERTAVLAPAGEPPRPLALMSGRLSAGFHWPSLRLAVLTDEELFGAKVHRPRTGRPKAAPFLSSFKELKPGDFVVHRDYGVGEYQGLTHLAVDGFETDYLTLRYEPDAKLYVPLSSLDLVQKYVAVEGAQPKVDRLGGQAWRKTRERIKKDILELARELAAIYAAREAARRRPLSPPDNLYREFESAFPYEETPDQLKAIDDVLGDMQKPRPMDRLVCGDVGFGKTEVALRAAFKAVEDGLQAAVLVPTTLLADQHYRTFSERLAPFSVTVELLSRFRTKAEQKETLARLKSGVADIVIGTHRLLQKDVVFRNLGLLVVDEEHRFGVKHKERVKEMRRMVDVLTLTATPIPRTLHLSLSGIRDLSIIQTPPLDRQAIQVVLARFGKRVIREAIMQELERGGQVFFVQNRVAGIERMAAYLQTLAPEARIGVAHGQMQEEEIETVMAQFVAGALNVLVTTTIIESGIDIPNANTIIINRADRFGLADLYQIKGRVGRGRRKAYAYLLTPAEEALSDLARKRLRAVQELSELGAGFRIAAQDLETRGAGNMLGKQQSGHIAAVGIDLYTEMMEEAMAELRGEESAALPDTVISLKASVFIPESYIGDMSLRLAAYKEISSVGSDEELERLAGDLRDRYGPLPDEAKNLLTVMSLKLAARAHGVARIDGGIKSVSVTFAEGATVSPDAVMALLKKNRGRITFVPEYTLRIGLVDESPAAAAEAVKKCLRDLGQVCYN